MDVIFPASPLLLYCAPRLLQLLLDPVLSYANNETRIAFSDPYSPHQLGTYPIGDATTAAQVRRLPVHSSKTRSRFLALCTFRSAAELSTHASLCAGATPLRACAALFLSAHEAQLAK
eukprot:1944540-Pleurochrysis_carterae.AAC.1